MPKNFRYRHGDPVKINFMPDAVTHRPHLAVGIARIASYWSEIELWWSICYTYLLGNSDHEAFGNYYSLRDWKKRRKLFLNAAQIQNLPGPMKNEAHDLFAEFESLAYQRNKVVHGNWAWSEQYPDSIFLAQSRSLGVNINRAFTALVKVKRFPERYPEITINFAEGTYEEYQMEDFDNAVRQIAELGKRINDFANRILPHSLEALVRRHGLK